MNTTKQSVDDLALFLGMHWFCSSDVQKKCYVECVLVLAKAAGLTKEEALQPFDLNRAYALSIWEELESA